MRSRQENPCPNSVNTGSVMRTISATVPSSASLSTNASAMPSRRALSRCDSGSLLVRMAMNTRLSMPSTTSMAIRVIRANQAAGSVARCRTLSIAGSGEGGGSTFCRIIACATFAKTNRSKGSCTMAQFKQARILVASAVLTAIGIAVGSPAVAADKKAPPEIPKCDKKVGTLAVTEPENKWWVQLNLESPEALIKVFVQQSGCFTLVDRGKGLAAAQAERALAG